MKSNQKITIWMPFYPGSYLKKTLHLTTEQHGAYLLLMLAYWENVGPLPDDDEYLASVTKMSLKRWQKMRPTLERFFDLNILPNEWVHERIDEELDKAFTNKQKAIDKARDAANKRWGNA